VRDAIFSVRCSQRESRVKLMSALPVNARHSGVPNAYAFAVQRTPLDVPIDKPHHADARALASRGPSAAPIRQPIAICHSSIILLSLRQACDVM